MSKHYPSYLSELSGIKLATKDDLKSITHPDTSSFALKSNLSSLKTEVDKLDIPRLSTVPADLAKLTGENQEDFTKKTDFNTLKTTVGNNKTSNDNLETTVQNNHLTAESKLQLNCNLTT